MPRLLVFLLCSGLLTVLPAQPAFQPGLNGATSVGGYSYFKEMATDDLIPLPTTVYRAGQFHTPGDSSRALFMPQLPRQYSVEETGISWTGKAVHYRGADYDLRMEVRSTLPGPLFVTSGHSIYLRWLARNEPPQLEGLASDQSWGPEGIPAPQEQVFLAHTNGQPTLLVASQPLAALRITSNRHWEVVFQAPGGSLLVVPLVDSTDIPREAAQQARWIALAQQPPLQGKEAFRFVDDRLELKQHFPGAAYAPLPLANALLGELGGFLDLPEDRQRLCHTFWGPYELVEGDVVQFSMATDWTQYTFAPTRKVRGEAPPVPEELAYAGDYTWDPAGSPMDQLLALRTWAPLLPHLPPVQQREVLARIEVPSAEQLRASLLTVVEPVTRQHWVKDSKLFDHQGDVAFDIDWYNGLSLSGLERATQCEVPQIALAARQLAEEARSERALMINYYTLFHDWFIGAAWNDSRGWLMDLDCSHNGIEGMLAEARMRSRAGDQAGAEWARYLAVKTAAFHLSTLRLRPWRLELDHGYVQPGAAGYGINGFHAWRELGSGVDAQARKQYFLASSFPEFYALLRDYAPREIFTGLAADWEAENQARYENWQRHYLGDDYRTRYQQSQWAQEARVQAAVFYSLAPEVFMRRWILGQSPEEVEALFQTPLNLAEWMHLRLGTELKRR